MSSEQRRKVRVFPTSIKHGALRNKVRAVQLAQLPWVALLDSDNLAGDDYFTPLMMLWQTRYGIGSLPPPDLAGQLIFALRFLTSGGVMSLTTRLSALRLATYSGRHGTLRIRTLSARLISTRVTTCFMVQLCCKFGSRLQPVT